MLSLWFDRLTNRTASVTELAEVTKSPAAEKCTGRIDLIYYVGFMGVLSGNFEIADIQTPFAVLDDRGRHPVKVLFVVRGLEVGV